MSNNRIVLIKLLNKIYTLFIYLPIYRYKSNDFNIGI